MSAVVNGSNAATFNKEVVSFTPNVGGEYGGRYQGPKAAVQAMMQTLILGGYAVKYSCDSSPFATVEFSGASSSGGGEPTDPNLDYVDNFQIFRNAVQKELLMSDHPMVAKINSKNMRQLQALIAAPKSATYNVDHVADQITAEVPASALAAQVMFDLHQSGVRSVVTQQPVLRVTRVTNPRYDAPFNVGLVDKILLTPTMLTDSGVPANFAVPILDLATTLAARTEMRAGGYAKRPDALILKFGWIKDVITCETVGKSKNQYSMEYKFGLWDTDLYGQPI